MNFFSIELAKYKVAHISMAFLIFNVFIFLFLFLLGLSTDEPMFPSINSAIHEINNAIIWPGCIVFTGVWAARIFIQEFRNKTIINIWASGVQRNRVMLAKLCLIGLIGWLGTMFTTLFLNSLLLVLAPYMNYAENGIPVASFLSTAFLIELSLSALCIGIAVLVSISFGLRGYSTSLTIISSLGVAIIWASQMHLSAIGLSTASFRWLMALISAASIFFLIKHLKRSDI